MNFEEFENWIKRHRRLSILLIALFCLGLVGEIFGYWTALVDWLTPDASFEILDIGISVRNSVYYEWDKLPEEAQPHVRRTQFSSNEYRQFRYDEDLVDSFGQRPPAKAVLTMYFAMQYAVAKCNLSIEVRSFFRDVLEANRQGQSPAEAREFLYELVPTKRFSYIAGTSTLVPFVQESEPRHREFLSCLSELHDEPRPQSFVWKDKAVAESRVQAYVQEYHALFWNLFLPVFEIHLRNSSQRAVVIDAVGAEVLDIAEYKGGAEVVPSSRILTIPIDYAEGMNRLDLHGDQQVRLSPGNDV